MTTFVRHGGTSHFMRPDGVTRTGVIQPVAGYSPAQDVQSVAGMFTNVYGPQLTTPLGGLRGGAMLLGNGTMLLGPNLGLFQRMKLAMQAWVAKKKAQKFVAAAVPPPAQVMAPSGSPSPNGASYQMGPQINAMPNQRAEMLMRIAQVNFPDGWGSNALDTIAYRWNGKPPR